MHMLSKRLETEDTHHRQNLKYPRATVLNLQHPGPAQRGDWGAEALMHGRSHPLCPSAEWSGCGGPPRNWRPASCFTRQIVQPGREGTMNPGTKEGATVQGEGRKDDAWSNPQRWKQER